MPEIETRDVLPSVQRWPSVAKAHEFVLPSYNWMIARVEAADSRIHNLGAFIATVSLAVPTLNRGLTSQLDFGSIWFVSAMVLALAAIIIAVFARSAGAILLPSPGNLYKTSLHLSEHEFQLDQIYFAGDAFEKNRALVKGKADAVAWMSGCFVLELVSLLLWLVRG